MKRAYLFRPNKLDFLPESPEGTAFWMIDGSPVWDLGDGVFQIICESGKLPEWAADADELRDIDKAPAKKSALSEKYQATCAAVSADIGKGIPAKEERTIPIPRVVLLGMIPEDLVADEKPEAPIDPKLGEGEAVPK